MTCGPATRMRSAISPIRNGSPAWLSVVRQFHRYLGYCFAGFTMPNPLGLSHEGVMWNAPGRAAALYAVGDHPQVHGFLNFALPEPPFAAFRDPAAQRELVAAVLADDGWEVPDMVRAMRTADDLFFDVISQICIPTWSRGRVVGAHRARVRRRGVTGPTLEG